MSGRHRGLRLVYMWGRRSGGAGVASPMLSRWQEQCMPGDAQAVSDIELGVSDGVVVGGGRGLIALVMPAVFAGLDGGAEPWLHACGTGKNRCGRWCEWSTLRSLGFEDGPVMARAAGQSHDSYWPAAAPSVQHNPRFCGAPRVKLFVDWTPGIADHRS